MKRKGVIISVIIIVLLVIVCFMISNFKMYKKEVSIGDTFIIPINKTVKIKDENLKLKLISSSDSRCKEGWQCIWQGELSYTIKVNNVNIKLGTETSKSAEYKDYNIVLVAENDSTDYVILRIEKSVGGEDDD